MKSRRPDHPNATKPPQRHKSHQSGSCATLAGSDLGQAALATCCHGIEDLIPKGKDAAHWLAGVSCPGEAVTECVVELCVDRWEEVAVGSEGHVDGGVAHAFHHRPRVGALGDEKRRVGVP